MPADPLLVLAFLVSGLVQVGLWFGLARLPMSRRTANVLAALAFAAMVTSAVWLEDNAWLYAHLPLKYGVVAYNLAPLWLVVTLACCAKVAPFGRVRAVAALVLVLALNGFYVRPLLFPITTHGPTVDGVATLQTTEFTCAPAAASTLFRLKGIELSEAELARRCLTTNRGTTIGGLYGGLRHYADQHGLTVMVAAPNRYDAALPAPAIVSVCLSRELDAADPRYRMQWGWDVGTPHAVVYLGRTADGKVRIADPRFGVETWDEAGLQALWAGKVVWLR